MLDLLSKLIRIGGKKETIHHEAHYNLSPKDAFSICRDFEALLNVLLIRQGGPRNFQWIKGSPGKTGALVKYELCQNGKWFTVRDVITEIDFDESTSVYTLSWKHFGGKTINSINNYTSTWKIYPYSDSESNGKTYSRLFWTQTFQQPLLFGIIPLTRKKKERLTGKASVAMNFLLRQYYEQAFPSTGKRLPKKSDRVAVIGAGPSGLHMAHVLKNRVGVEDITILERSNRFGGKTATIDSSINFDKENEKGIRVVHEMGTCYLHPAYFTVRAYMQELKELMVAKGIKIPEGFAEEVEPIKYDIRRTGQETLDLEGWITANMQVQPRFSFMSLLRILLPSIAMKLELKMAQLKYMRIHRRIFGYYDYSMPPRLSPEKMAEIDMPFGEFLEKHKLTALSPLLAYGNTAQGYGSIEKVPAFWALCWITPELMEGYFRMPKQDPPKKTIFKTGWLRMWEATVEVNNLRIELNIDIDRIIRQDNGKVVVTGRQREVVPGDAGEVLEVLSVKGFYEEFDYLVIAAPLYNSSPVGSSFETLTGVVNKVVPLDLEPNEEALLRTNTLVQSQFRTMLYQSNHQNACGYAHLDIYANEVLGCNSGNGDVFAVRDSYLSLHPEYSTAKGHAQDPLRGKKRELIAVQWAESGKSMSLEDLDDKSSRWAVSELGNAEENFQVRKERHWNYFQRYNREGLMNYNNWKVLELQGANNTLFVHASTFFESTQYIMDYNNMLIDGLQGRLNAISEKPKFQYSNTEVEADGPAVRHLNKPLYYQTDHWKLFYNKVTKLVFSALNIVLGLVWMVFHAVLRPILEFTLYRYRRYAIAKSIARTKVGAWWHFNRIHFLRSLPSVKCYLQETEHSIEQNGVLRRIDPMMEIVAPVLRKERSAIPLVRKSLMLSEQDFRRVAQLWMKETKFSPRNRLLESLISRLSLQFPVLFNYVTSWFAVLRFGALSGHGYRVEDKKGGGLYFRKCRLMTAARKAFGDELGCRIYTHAYKIFQEEASRHKGTPLIIEPNFENGSCMIRKVAVRDVVFHNHALNRGMRVGQVLEDFEEGMKVEERDEVIV